MKESGLLRRCCPSGSLLVAAALALLLHGAWYFLWARPWTPSGTAPRAVEAPRFTYLTAAQSGRIEEERRLGSPVLFALPSAQGFSGNPAASAPIPAALRTASSETVALTRTLAREDGGNYLRRLDQTVGATAPAPPATAATTHRAFTTATGSTGFVVRLYWPDGAPSVRAGLPGAGVLAPVLKDRPWELTAVLEFDALGSVQHVFIEKPTSLRERNEFVARTLRAIRIESGGVESRVRVLVQYDQDGGSRTLTRGAVQP